MDQGFPGAMGTNESLSRLFSSLWAAMGTERDQKGLPWETKGQEGTLRQGGFLPSGIGVSSIWAATGTEVYQG